MREIRKRVYFKEDILRLVNHYWIGSWVTPKIFPNGCENFDTDTKLRLTLEYLARVGYKQDYILDLIKSYEESLHREAVEFVL